jgi:hypothetical protein
LPAASGDKPNSPVIPLRPFYDEIMKKAKSAAHVLVFELSKQTVSETILPTKEALPYCNDVVE